MTTSILLNRWEHLGITFSDANDTVYGEHAETQLWRWFHILLAPLASQELQMFFDNNSAMSGSSYAEYLKTGNGVKLFNGDLYLLGIHPNSGKSRNAFLIPWDIVTENLGNSSIRQQHTGFIIGGQRLAQNEETFMELGDGTFISIDNETRKIIKKWITLNDLLCHYISVGNKKYLGQ